MAPSMHDNEPHVRMNRHVVKHTGELNLPLGVILRHSGRVKSGQVVEKAMASASDGV